MYHSRAYNVRFVFCLLNNALNLIHYGNESVVHWHTRRISHHYIYIVKQTWKCSAIKYRPLKICHFQFVYLGDNFELNDINCFLLHALLSRKYMYKFCNEVSFWCHSFKINIFINTNASWTCLPPPLPPLFSKQIFFLN